MPIYPNVGTPASRLITRLIVAAGLFLTPLAHATFETPGQLDVSPTGAASYTIPIAVPPGTAGMAPNLALVYNSQGGNGLLGMGWSLAGLSVIHRCGRTLIQDGVRATVNYNANDKYCMDGQRLVPVAATVSAPLNCTSSTEYRTERESFTRIHSCGVAGSGPAYFIAKTKSGQTMEFGNTLDSRIEAQGRADIRIYAVNKISDTKGNTLTFSYTEDNINGDYRPDRIDYTGNAAAALLPYNSVRFVYQGRTDITKLFLGSSFIKVMQRLANVQTYAKVKVNGVDTDTLVKDYRLTYQATLSPSTGRSRLASFQECDGTLITVPAPTCLSATTLVWNDGGGGLTASDVRVLTTTAPDWKTAYKVIPGDYNGDGIQDLYLIGSLSSHFCAGPTISATNNCQQILNSAWNPTYSVYPGDYNGDGVTDLFRIGTANSYFCAGPGISSANNCQQVVTGDWKTPYSVYPGDYNGDGVSDLFLLIRPVEV